MYIKKKILEKYKRQIIIPEIGIIGQIKLSTAKALVIGAGGLGSPACLYLAASGIKELGILDSDNVELSNLQRQILHFEKDIGISKVNSAKEKLNQFNSVIKLNIYHERLDSNNINEIFPMYNVIVDATDNYDTKSLISKGCNLLSKPCIHAGIKGWEGQIMTVFPNKTACFMCVFPEKPLSEENSSVLGAVAGILGSMQALQAIKVILNLEETKSNTLLFFNGLDLTFRKIKLNKQKNCVLCGQKA